MRSKTAKFGLFLFVSLLIVLIAGQILVPRIGSWYIEREIKKSCPVCEKIDISIKAFPFFKLFMMNYDKLQGKADKLTVEGIDFENITLNSNGWPGASYETWVTEEETYGVFSVSTSYLSRPTLVLKDGYINAYGIVYDDFLAANVHIKGTLVPVDGSKIFLSPVLVEVESPIADEAIKDKIEQTTRDTPIFYLHENLPFTVSEIKITNGKLRFRGYIDLSRALKEL